MRTKLLLLTSLVGGVACDSDSICEVLAVFSPACSCQEDSKYSAALTCNANIGLPFGLPTQTVGVSFAISPCVEPMSFNLNFDLDGNTFPLEDIKAGEPMSLPVPGASIPLNVGICPLCADFDAGLFATYEFSGNIDALDMQLGLQFEADVDVLGVIKWQGKEPNPPFSLLSDTVSFGDVCASASGGGGHGGGGGSKTGVILGSVFGALAVLGIVACFFATKKKKSSGDSEPMTDASQQPRLEVHQASDNQ